MQAGLQEAAANLDIERQSRVVLLSDGLATVGDTADESILEMAADYISQGIGLTTIGVGLDFNVDLMRGLSERGAGNFYFVEDSQAVTEVFTEELDYFVSPLALSVSVSVEAQAGYRLGEVHGTRLWKTNPSGGDMFLPAVFVASRTGDENPNGRRGGGSALFIDLDAQSGFDAGTAATITLTYRLPGSTEQISQTVDVTNPLAPRELDENLYVSYVAMAEHYAVYNMFLGLRRATQHAEVGDYDCAVATLNAAEEDGVRWNAEYADSDIAADLELVDQFRGLLVERGARREASMDGCADLGPDWGNDWEGDDVVYVCSATGGPSGSHLAVLLALLGAFGLRRRRTTTH